MGEPRVPPRRSSDRAGILPARMHLRAIKLRGFKSFPEPVEIRLEPGVAVVVGPNGSGKSNIADALIWAAGSLAPSELRAEKPDDVLFVGSATRSAAAHCEVELLFDNGGGELRRRLLRGLDHAPAASRRRGPVPGQRRARAPHGRRRAARRRRARLRDGLDRLPGAGGGDPRLEARGAEAAGRGGGRARTLQAAAAPRRAEAGTRRHPGRARARRRGRGREAAAAARVAGDRRRAGGEARRGDRRAAGRYRDAGSRLRSRRRSQAAAGRHAGFAAEKRRADERAGRRCWPSAAAPRRRLPRRPAAGRARQATLYRLRSAAERLEIRLRGGADAAQAAARGAAARRRRACSSGRASPRRGRPRSSARSPSAKGFRRPPARSPKKARRSRSSLADVEPGYERAVAAAVGAALVAATPEEGLRLLEQARERGLGNLTVLVRPERVDPLDGCRRGRPARSCSASTAARRDAGRPLLRSGAGRARPSPATLPRRCCSSWRRSAGGCSRRRRSLREQASRALPQACPTRPSSRRPRRSSRRCPLRSARPSASRRRCWRTRTAEQSRAGELAAELRALGGREVELRRAWSEASERAAAVDVEVARLEAERDEARRRLEQAGSEPAEGVARGARREAGAVRAPPRAARRREPVREGGVRARRRNGSRSCARSARISSASLDELRKPCATS